MGKTPDTKQSHQVEQKKLSCPEGDGLSCPGTGKSMIICSIDVCKNTELFSRRNGLFR
jgi:hypothetical protein